LKRLVAALGVTALSIFAFAGTPAATHAANGVSAQHVPVCGAVPVGYARCHSILVLRSDGKPGGGGATVSGYVPADLQSAYNPATASASAGSGQTVAIVDACDDPNAESDVNTYRSQFGIAACTTANGCFRKIDQTGGTRCLEHEHIVRLRQV